MKKILAIIIAVALTAALLPSCKKGPLAQYESEDNFVVQPAGSNGTARITEYLDETRKSSINIPPRIQKMAVTEIGPGSIADFWFAKVALPKTVVVIMDFAFSGNLIRELSLPDKLAEIGNGAFMDNRLASIVIPDSVRKIGYRAFCNNPLKSVTIGSDVELGEIGGYDSGKDEEWQYTAFEGTGFDEAYNGNGRMAGTYTLENSVWQFAPRPAGKSR